MLSLTQDTMNIIEIQRVNVSRASTFSYDIMPSIVDINFHNSRFVISRHKGAWSLFRYGQRYKLCIQCFVLSS